jgi:predicted PurR-regulated permease PerM
MNPVAGASATENPAATARGYRPAALALLTLALLALCVLLLLPFLPALAWGVALAVVAWPLHTRLSSHVSHAWLAAGLTTLIVLVLIVAPGLFVAYQLAREASSTADWMRSEQAGSSVRNTLAGAPGMAGAVAWLERVGVNVDREVHRLIERNTRDLTALVQGSLMAVVQFVVALFILFHLLLDRASLLARVRALLPMTRGETERVVASAADSIHANLHANFITSLIDGIGGGLVFYLLGLPSPVTWGAVMFFLSFIPMFGTWLAWGPAAFYLALTGHWIGAALMLLWGLVSMFVVGYVIYTWLAGQRMRLHPVATLLAFLGGLSLFGVSGIILGPGIVAVTVAVLDVWHERANGTAPLAEATRDAAASTPDRPLPFETGPRRPEIVPSG